MFVGYYSFAQSLFLAQSLFIGILLIGKFLLVSGSRNPMWWHFPKPSRIRRLSNYCYKWNYVRINIVCSTV